jgi:cell division septal protein FtsQ
MIKERVHTITITFIVFLFGASAFGYFFLPASMLSVVGIEGNEQVNFLVRTLAAALVALIPGA